MSEESISEPTDGSESHKTEEPLILRTGSALSVTYYRGLKYRSEINYERGKQIPYEERVRIANIRMKRQRERKQQSGDTVLEKES
jgi:hypothetical protein